MLCNSFTPYNECDALTRRFANAVSILAHEVLILVNESLILDDENIDRNPAFKIGVEVRSALSVPLGRSLALTLQ